MTVLHPKAEVPALSRRAADTVPRRHGQPIDSNLQQPINPGDIVPERFVERQARSAAGGAHRSPSRRLPGCNLGSPSPFPAPLALYRSNPPLLAVHQPDPASASPAPTLPP